MPRSGFEPTLDRTIECSLRAPAEARRAVEDLADELDARLVADIQLVVSELVTNSVRHSGSDQAIRLRAWLRSSGVKVEIADGGYGFEPDDRERDHAAEGGRGLLILEALAERWGVQHDTRSRVWFELSAQAEDLRGSRRLTNAAS